MVSLEDELIVRFALGLSAVFLRTVSVGHRASGTTSFASAIGAICGRTLQPEYPQAYAEAGSQFA